MARNMYSQSAYVLSDMGDSDDFELQAQQQRAALARREYLGDFKYRNDPHSRAKGSRHYYFNKEQLHDLARRTVQLVPIRLDLEVEGVKLRDQFTWNLNETLITPEQFATLLADDFDSPYAHQFVPLIAEEIRRQVQNYGVAAEEDPDAEGKPRIKVDENDETAYGELRIAVKLDLNVGTLHLTDQFEWPLFSTSSMTPEDFAKQLASDLGVGGEFVPVIAHAIREQVCFARMNYNDATPAPPLRGRPFRAENVEDEWEPELRELTEEDIERIVKEKERNTRRLRRQHRQTLGRNTSTAATTPYPQRSDTPQSTGFRDRPSRATNSIYASNRPPLRGSNLNEYAASPGPEPTPAPTRERYAASPAPAPIQRYASADVPDVPQHAVQPHVNSTSVPQQAYTPHPSHSGTQMQNFTPVAPVASHPLYSMESNYTHQQYPYPFATSTASIPPSSLPAYSGLSMYNFRPYVPPPSVPYTVPSFPTSYAFAPQTSLPPTPIRAPQFADSVTQRSVGNPLVAPPVAVSSPNVAAAERISPPKQSAPRIPPAFDPELQQRQMEMMRKTIQIIKEMQALDDRDTDGLGAQDVVKVGNEDGTAETSEPRHSWRCYWCGLDGPHTPTIRRGPLGKNTFCNACGIHFSKNGFMQSDRYQENLYKVWPDPPPAPPVSEPELGTFQPESLPDVTYQVIAPRLEDHYAVPPQMPTHQVPFQPDVPLQDHSTPSFPPDAVKLDLGRALAFPPDAPNSSTADHWLVDSFTSVAPIVPQPSHPTEVPGAAPPSLE